jgi:hypothetical protein
MTSLPLKYAGLSNWPLSGVCGRELHSLWFFSHIKCADAVGGYLTEILGLFRLEAAASPVVGMDCSVDCAGTPS